MLTVEREGETLVVDGKWRFREGDRVAIALHLPEREDAMRELANRGFTPAPDPAPESEATSAEEAEPGAVVRPIAATSEGRGG